MGTRFAPALVAAVVLLALGRALPGAAGEEAPKNPGEVEAAVQAVGTFPFITPKEALGELPAVSFSGGKGTLAAPVKAGKVTVYASAGGVAVDVAGDGKNLLKAALFDRGFSTPLAFEVAGSGEKPNLMALSFAHARKGGGLVCRNTAVACARFADHTVWVIDDNCNGQYGDAGEDAVIVDNGRLAAPLGSTLVLGVRHYRLQITADGRKMTFTPTDTKLGAAAVSNREGYACLLGAVTKGPDGGYYVLGQRTAEVVPAGEHTLEYACFRDAGGRNAAVSGGQVKLTVAEGRRVSLLSLGTPTLGQAKAAYDHKRREITVQPPAAEDIKCKAGTFVFDFPMPPARVSVWRLYRGREERVMSHQTMTSQGGKLRPLVIDCHDDEDLKVGALYRIEVLWALGVIPDAKASVELRLNRK